MHTNYQKRRTNVNEIFHKLSNGNAKFSYYYTISMNERLDLDSGPTDPTGCSVFDSNCFTDKSTEINIIERGKRALRTSCHICHTVAPPIGLLLG